MSRPGPIPPVDVSPGAGFYVTLVPVLNQPLNLNTRNGDRLLLLPGAGDRPRRRGDWLTYFDGRDMRRLR